MRAAYITELGPADAIRVGELPSPVPGPTDVLVRVELVVVDPVDTLVRSGAYRTPTPFPFVVGRDLVGTVAAAGPGVAGFAPGDRVWCNSLGHDGRQGSFAEFAVVPVERLYHLPEGADPVASVAVAHPAATAHLALFRHGRLRPGETVYVGGAAGNVSSAASSLARMGGARVLAGARPEDAEWCRAAGAAEVLDYRDPDLPDRLRALAPGGIDLYTNDRSILGFAISLAAVGDLAEAASMIDTQLAAGTLPARVRDIWPLDRAAEPTRRSSVGCAAASSSAPVPRTPERPGRRVHPSGRRGWDPRRSGSSPSTSIATTSTSQAVPSTARTCWSICCSPALTRSAPKPMKPPSLPASAAAWAATSSHRRNASASSGVALAVTSSLTSRSSSSTCWPPVGLKSPKGFCRCRVSACTSKATAASSSSWLGGRVADRKVAVVSLATSIGPPGSASEIATPATNGARRIRVHSWSVKSCLDVMATSWERGVSPTGQ
jgi:NADPH:quinone reductase-like Zn-dependent oxidoreductase